MLRGAWMAANAAESPMYSPWRVVSSRHDDDEPADERRRDAIIEGTPQAPGAAGEPGRGLVTQAGGAGARVDQTPTVAHDTVEMFPGMTREQAGQQHSVRLGADVRRQIALPRLLIWGDGPAPVVEQDMGLLPHQTDGSGRLSLIRGLNGYPENNPERVMYSEGGVHAGPGWRRGEWLVTRDRHRIALPTRHPRFRVLYRDRSVARVETDRPAEDGPYASGGGFDALARPIRRRFNMPRVRREPADVGESATTDGLSDPYASASVGRFV